MRQVFAYYRQLWRLWRTRRENPLVRACNPRKQTRFLSAMALLQRWAGPALLVLVAVNQFLLWDPTQRSEWLMINLLLTFSAFLVFSVPINLALYAGRWRDRARLQDLAMTPMTRREATFGIVYWPVVIGAGNLVWIFLSWMIVLAVDEMRYSWNTGFWEEMVLPAGGGLAAIALSAAVAVRYYFTLSRLHWLVIFPTFFSLLAQLILVTMVALAGDALMQEYIPYDGPHAYLREYIPPLWLAFVLTVLLLFHGWLAGHLAPVRLFETVFPDVTERFSLFHNARGTVRRKELKPLLQEALRRHARTPWLASVGCLVAAAVALFFVLWTATLDSRLPLPESPIFATLNLLTVLPWLSLAMGLLLLVEGRRNRWRPLALVSGRLDVSVLRRMLPLFLLWSVAVAALVAHSHNEPSYNSPGALRLVFVGFLGFILSIAGWVPVLSGYALALGSRRPWIATALVAVLPLALVAWLYVQEMRVWGELQGLMSSRFYTTTSQNAWGVTGTTVAVVLLYLLPFSFQRLFSRRLAGLELGEVSPPLPSETADAHS